MIPWHDRWTVWVWHGDHWMLSAGRHKLRRTAVISQQWWEYVEGRPALIVPPGDRT